MLAIEVQFLTGRYVATDYRSRETPEWPPHPDRLFSALLAVAAEAGGVASDGNGGVDEASMVALRWLESQPPPMLHAGTAHARNAPIVYVPVDDDFTVKQKGCVLPETRTRQPRQFPSVTLEAPTVCFIWPEAEPEPAIRKTLAALVSRLGRLGHSSSLVQTRLTESPPLPTHVPDARAGDMTLRVPTPGRLALLQHLFAVGRRPTPGALVRYRKVQDAPAEAMAQGPFVEMIVFEKIAGPAIDIAFTVAVTSVMRDAVIKAAGMVTGQVPELLHGHGETPHVAYAALPFVGHRHADGHLMGVAALLPRGVDKATRRTVLRCMARVSQLQFRQLGAWEVRPRPMDSMTRALMPETWTRPSRTWVTVSPVLLDRHPKKHLSAERILLESLTRAGLPAPDSLALDEAPMLAGSCNSRAFEQRHKPDLPRRFATHVTLTFATPVIGPLLLGAGRYFGLGLFRPCDGEVRQERQELRHAS
ncbi:type I-G CRISPR-associated protein Csb2 [Megalodesulfovibrio gigas]|uniref:Putative CRISPR-associated protein n=1 Tax=Megalodesulfovibrio gigas (strain ATCC 19364 / DSM 1382 / NCIMB 9332 / VKM B-1759) TaxID=1121448 RepID=T2GE64_MEGG1|nr:type I-U CRISPR-associated protein Csb2 [Megalodesulfovibrio gigas]AGW14192.1 putative CRISPR-associated protein [Megalodesulfovibrio gigas DSM 1382 = ATCC 19364]